MNCPNLQVSISKPKNALNEKTILDESFTYRIPYLVFPLFL